MLPPTGIGRSPGPVASGLASKKNLVQGAGPPSGHAEPLVGRVCRKQRPLQGNPGVGHSQRSGRNGVPSVARIRVVPQMAGTPSGEGQEGLSHFRSGECREGQDQRLFHPPVGLTAPRGPDAGPGAAGIRGGRIGLADRFENAGPLSGVYPSGGRARFPV